MSDKEAKIFFHPKAKRSALNTYEFLSKYGNQALKSKADKSINSRLCGIYESITLDDKDQFRSEFRAVCSDVSFQDRDLSVVISFFRDAVKDCALLTLNSALIQTLEGSGVNDNGITFIIEKMREKRMARKKGKVVVEIDNEVMPKYLEEIKRVPRSQARSDQNSFKQWIGDVVLRGIEEVSEDPSWGDHALAGNWRGSRSVRVSFQGRIIYKVERIDNEGEITNKITILRLTSSHDYSKYD